MTKIAIIVKPDNLFMTKTAAKPYHLGPHIPISTFLFHHYQIYKEAAFGRLNYNVCLLDGYTPSMFSNGVPHENQKTFLMRICKIAQQSKIFETSVKLIKEYSTTWQNAGNVTFYLLIDLFNLGTLLPGAFAGDDTLKTSQLLSNFEIVSCVQKKNLDG